MAGFLHLFAQCFQHLFPLLALLLLLLLLELLLLQLHDVHLLTVLNSADDAQHYVKDRALTWSINRSPLLVASGLLLQCKLHLLQLRSVRFGLSTLCSFLPLVELWDLRKPNACFNIWGLSHKIIQPILSEVVTLLYFYIFRYQRKGFKHTIVRRFTTPSQASSPDVSDRPMTA